MAKATATVHGAVSIVNAIANQKGATLGISLRVEATVESSPGKGISIRSENKSLSSRLINKTVEKIVSKRDLGQNKITVTLDSEIPTGYGLKSSSAISSAVALACAKVFRPKLTDQQILLTGVDASIESKVSITGAYDDACSCYYGGFNVTDNAKKKRVQWEEGPANLVAVIFIPKNRKRGNLKKLKILSTVFESAWELARKANYWEAMTINGLATASILNSDPKIIAELVERGARRISVWKRPIDCGNSKKESEAAVKKVFSSLEGDVIVSGISNKKAEVHEV